MKGVHFRVNEWEFYSIVLLRPALDRTIVQGSNLVHLESDVGAIEWMYFASLCMYVVSEVSERKLYLYETPMYFNYVAYFVYNI